MKVSKGYIVGRIVLGIMFSFAIAFFVWNLTKPMTIEAEWVDYDQHSQLVLLRKVDSVAFTRGYGIEYIGIVTYYSIHPADIVKTKKIDKYGGLMVEFEPENSTAGTTVLDTEF